MPRPATLIDGVLIFAGGDSRPLTEPELQQLGAGAALMADPRTGRRTPLVGDDEGSA